jgi:hypothetical protein
MLKNNFIIYLSFLISSLSSNLMGNDLYTDIISPSEVIYNLYDKLLNSQPNVQIPDESIHFQHKKLKTYKQPQSLAILMNFDQNGKSSYLLIDYDKIYWSDLAHCSHGQIFDPLIGLCRDIFCVEGYIFTPRGCEADLNDTLLAHSHKKLPDEVHVEINIKYEYLTESNLSLNYSYLLSENENFLQAFRKTLAYNLRITEERLSGFTHDEPIIEQKDFQISSEKEGSKLFSFSENFDIRFKIESKNLFLNDERESLQIYYDLYALFMYKQILYVNDFGVILTDVEQVDNKDNLRWCDEFGEEKVLIYKESDFRILALFNELGHEKEYFIYINRTQILYTQGKLIV